ncbi:MAG: hypothetical protein AB8H80_11595 [Planctomycetota bacterium]
MDAFGESMDRQQYAPQQYAPQQYDGQQHDGQQQLGHGRADADAGGDRVGPDTFGVDEWHAIDLLLEQGNRDELAQMRRKVSSDPMLALELADTVSLVEQFRHLRTDASPEFAGRLEDVSRKAERHRRSHFEPASKRWHMLALMAASAALTFGLLHWLDLVEKLVPSSRDPIGGLVLATVDADSRAGSRAQAARAGSPLAGGSAAKLPVGEWPSATSLGTSSDEPFDDQPVDDKPFDDEPVDYEDMVWGESMQAIRRRLDQEGAGRNKSDLLREALEAGLDASGDPLAQWLLPSNQVELSRLDHELRASAAVRADALRRRGALVAVDGRVQELADEIAAGLWAMVGEQGTDLEGVDLDRVETIAWSVRALIGAGSTAQRVLPMRAGGDWLAARLHKFHGERLVWGLSALAELAAISGQHFEAVAEHGARLANEVLVPDEERWSRRRPELLQGRIDARALGEAGRVLARLPAFGIESRRCLIVRQLILGQLRERRAASEQDRPETLAAMLYGYRDLLEHVVVAGMPKAGQPDRLADGMADTLADSLADSMADATQAGPGGGPRGGDEAAVRSESDQISQSLRRWRLRHLAPDFRVVQQIAWSLQPGNRGSTRLQRELRRIAVVAAPNELRERAAFCLCLATNYAGFVGALLPHVPARSTRGL